MVHYISAIVCVLPYLLLFFIFEMVNYQFDKQYVRTNLGVYSWLIATILTIVFIYVFMRINDALGDSIENLVGAGDKILFESEVHQLIPDGNRGIGKIYFSNNKIIYIPNIFSIATSNNFIKIISFNEIERLILCKSGWMYFVIKNKTLKYIPNDFQELKQELDEYAIKFEYNSKC